MQGVQIDFISWHFTSRAQHNRLQEQVAISTKVGRHSLGNLGVQVICRSECVKRG